MFWLLKSLVHESPFLYSRGSNSRIDTNNRESNEKCINDQNKFEYRKHYYYLQNIVYKIHKYKK